jgi:hypothetical protein
MTLFSTGHFEVAKQLINASADVNYHTEARLHFKNNLFEFGSEVTSCLGQAFAFEVQEAALSVAERKWLGLNIVVVIFVVGVRIRVIVQL